MSDIQKAGDFGKDIDEKLCELWAYYSDERYDTKMLVEPVVHFVSPIVFYRWLEAK
jgi:hypothetical protein